MTREEETAERNACDEYFHEHKPVSIQDMWMERARRAEDARGAALREVRDMLLDQSVTHLAVRLDRACRWIDAAIAKQGAQSGQEKK